MKRDRVKDNKVFHYDRAIPHQLRVKAGAFYTPLAVARNMVEESLFYYLIKCGYSERNVASFLKGTLSHGGKKMLRQLECIKWLDMACGTGVFAYAYIENLHTLATHYLKEHVDSFINKAMANMVLNDINADAIHQFPLLIKEIFMMTFTGHCIVSDALLALDDTSIIKDILIAGGFDIVIGNPPYLGERGNKEIFQPLKSSPKLRHYYDGKMDLFYFFIHKGIELLSKNGVMTQITTSYFTTADGAKKLRQSLKYHCDFNCIHLFENLGLFKDIYSLSFMTYTLSLKCDMPVPCHVKRGDKTFFATQEQLYDKYGQIQMISSEWKTILDKMIEHSQHTLDDIININQGIVSGADRERKGMQKKDVSLKGTDNPIFIFKSDEYTEDEHLKPFIKNSEVLAYGLDEKVSHYILYSTEKHLSKEARWLHHLAPYKVVLSQRREVKSGTRKWYELQWPRQQAIFEGEKIIVPQRARRNTFAYVKKPLYGSADIYFLTLKEELNIAISSIYFNRETALKALTIYLNSPLVYLWLYYYGKRKGKLLELYDTPLQRIPLPLLDASLITLLASGYDEYIQRKDQKILDDMHLYLYRIFCFSDDEIKCIERFLKEKTKSV